MRMGSYSLVDTYLRIVLAYLCIVLALSAEQR